MRSLLLWFCGLWWIHYTTSRVTSHLFGVHIILAHTAVEIFFSSSVLLFPDISDILSIEALPRVAAYAADLFSLLMRTFALAVSSFMFVLIWNHRTFQRVEKPFRHAGRLLKKFRKPSNSRLSAYRGTVGRELRRKSKSLRSKHDYNKSFLICHSEERNDEESFSTEVRRSFALKVGQDFGQKR